MKRMSTWPLAVLSAPAFVAVWSGWVGLGRMTGFGEVELLPGVADVRVNTAVTLPIGAEVLGVLAARAWLDPDVGLRARRFAHRLLWVAAIYGAAGQAAYHLMTAAGWEVAPWPVTLVVSVLPVGVIVLGLILSHLIRLDEPAPEVAPARVTVEPVKPAPPTPPVPAAPRPVAQLPASSRALPSVDDRPGLVAWVRGLESRPTDRALGARFGRSRTWGATLLREAAQAERDHSGDGGGEDHPGTGPGDPPVAAQAMTGAEQSPVPA